MLQEKNEFSIFSMERITKSFSYEEVMSIEPRKVRKKESRDKLST